MGRYPGRRTTITDRPGGRDEDVKSRAAGSHAVTSFAVGVGEYEVTAILDGREGLDEAFATSFPEAGRSDDWIPWHRRHPELVTGDGRWRLHVWCALIRGGDRAVLVDTGLGPVISPAHDWWLGGEGRLLGRLADLGVAGGTVDTVVVTHVHDDHLGGALAARGVPAFPNARHLLNRTDRDWVDYVAATDEDARAVRDGIIAPLEGAGLVDLVTGDEEIMDGVRLRRVPGHTPGHQVVEVRSGNEVLVIAGDVFNHPAQIAWPDWSSGTDHDAQRAAASRLELLRDLRDGRRFAPAHFAEPFGTAVPARVGDITCLLWQPDEAVARPLQGERSGSETDSIR